MRSRFTLVGVCLVLCGVCLRVPGLGDPPLDFHPTRQYRSGIIARGYSLDLLPPLDPAARQAAATAARSLPPIEPPIMEHLASWVYHRIGREDLAAARALSVLAWALGGLAMFWLAVQLVTAPAAVAAVAVWTFLPFAIQASRSFQPDPLMTALVVFTLAAAVSYRRRPTMAGGALFGCGLAAALAVKAMAVFFLGPSLFALFILDDSPARSKAVTVAIAIVALAPAAWYYSTLPLATGYGPFSQLLSQREFWSGWATMVDRVVSWPLPIAAVAGAMFATGILRRLLPALFAGYVAFGIIFTHHIQTHDYYSLPLVPIVALGVGALLDRIGRVRPAWSRGAAAVVCVACLAAGVAAVVEARRSERIAALRGEAARYERIGRIVGHSGQVLALDGAYGYPLVYHGYMNAAAWPLSGDLAVLPLTGGSVGPADARLRSSGAEFFVCTIQPEMDAQPDLKEALEREHPLIERDGAPERWGFVVYDLRRGILSARPDHLSMFTRVGAPAAAEHSVSLFAPAAARWTVAAPEGSSLAVRPLEGTGPATLHFTTAAPAAEGDRTVKVSIDSATHGSASIEVRIRAVAGPDTPPFGSVDAPPDPVTLGRDPVLFQGWALDDISMTRVWVGYLDAGGRLVPLGDARRGGRRPDVAAAFPAATDLFKAAWAFTLDPATVRNVPRPIRLRFFAEDGAGQRGDIGQRTVR